ncbi:Bacteriochlorophyllide d C-8(2)-methyltransferase [Planctomycetaceae bacterium]|nr:Bacteriochlorophyllide d C-8(2)-methyltransferase [Planctomycetaceae bacterium]
MTLTDEATLHDTRKTAAQSQFGPDARVLLSSVFGPYAQDDEYGSRLINPMELYHNQVTRVQGPFSLRIFHRSWGLMMIQANLRARTTLLDFPTLERFTQELIDNDYDVVGISSILVNVLKVKKMCELIRKHRPKARIVIGGHIANLPDLDKRIDADHIVKGEGVAWFRRFLGEDAEAPLNHPAVLTPINMRVMGVEVPNNAGETAATLIPSVGCPLGCNFCSTSHMFGGKGKFVNFFDADEIFHILCELERQTGAVSFFVMDENFLLQKPRALKVLELMEKHKKAWTFYLFASANVLKQYTYDQLVRLGISWVWLGLEGKQSQYNKLHGTDSHALVKELQSHGIRVLGSSIIGLEEHTPENIEEAIEYAVAHDSDFHQFMLYTPLPGTGLHREMSGKELLVDETQCDLPEVHGQYKFNFKHPHIRDGQETEYLLRAFRRDFEANGPSIVRMVRTMLNGWLRYKDHPDERVRRRFKWEAKTVANEHIAVVTAAVKYYKKINPAMYAKLEQLRKDIVKAFGLKTRIISKVGGIYVTHKMKKEMKRLAEGQTWEPPTFYEHNFEPGPLVKGKHKGEKCKFVKALARA